MALTSTPIAQCLGGTRSWRGPNARWIFPSRHRAADAPLVASNGVATDHPRFEIDGGIEGSLIGVTCATPLGSGGLHAYMEGFVVAAGS
jgi:hypothetical protein